MVSDDRCRGEDHVPGPAISDGGQRFDEVFSALADARRRRVLHCLDADERASQTAVARQVAAWEHECPPDDVPQEVIDSIEAELYHRHLPKLREAKIVEYDDRSEMLVFRDPPELVELCLDHCASRDLPS